MKKNDNKLPHIMRGDDTIGLRISVIGGGIVIFLIIVYMVELIIKG